MKVLDLFSGIGGFSIGLEKEGFETVAFCEIEPYCRGVLERHWPDVPIYGDVKQLTGEQLRADGIIPNVIVGGYPCQPFSVAGKQRGTEDDRHLWPEVFRLVKEIRPTWCIFENVAGHIRLGLDQVLSDLESEGYATRPFVIPAAGVDAPHRRDRVWIVAHTRHQSGRDSISRGSGGDGKWKHEKGEWSCEATQVARPGEASEALADTSSKRLQGRTEEQVYGVKGLSEQSQGGSTNFGNGWPVEPRVGRVANGIPNRTHRIKALGNAVVPQIPQVIGKIIKIYEKSIDMV